MKKILVPVDGSEASVKAAKTAIDLAKKYGSEITLVTVIEEDVGLSTAIGDISGGLSSMSGGIIHLDMEEMRKQRMERGKKILDFVQQRAVPDGVNTEKKVLIGIADSEIIQEAKAGGYGLIVMGRRGLSRMERFFVGSVTQRVLAETPCAVYIEKE